MERKESSRGLTCPAPWGLPGLIAITASACIPDFEIPTTSGPCGAPPPVEVSVPPDEWFSHIIEGGTRREALLLEGPEWNRTLVRNLEVVDVEGDAIRLKGVSDVWIVDNQISRCTGAVRLLATGSTSSVTIARNTFRQLSGVGVAALEADGVKHSGLRVLGNRFESVGLSGAQGRSPAALLVATEFLAEANSICEAEGGDGIRAGGPGAIRRNSIRNAKRSGVRYNPAEDGFPGPGGKLVIENNLAFGTFGASTFEILGGGPGLAEVEVRFNTGVHFSSRDATLKVAEGAPAVSATGNLLAHLLGSSEAVRGPLRLDEANLRVGDLTGFVSGLDPIDLHLLATHPARGGAGGVDAPGDDLDGDERPSPDGRVDVGADQSP